MSIKKGVSIANLTPQMLFGNQIVESVFTTFGYNLRVTSGCEGRHGRASLHFVGNALDYGLTNSDSDDLNIKSKLKHCLGEQYDVVLEKDHFHVEYQPKKGTNQ